MNRRGFLGLLGAAAATAAVGGEAVKQFAIGQYNDIKFIVGVAPAPARFAALTKAVRDVYSAEIWFVSLPVLRFDQFANPENKVAREQVHRTKYSDYMERYGV